MSQARELLEGAGKRSIADQGFVSQCTSKWKHLVEGIKDPYMKGATAILLENQRDYLMDIQEDTLSSNAGSFTKYIFPILRRVFPNLIAPSIVSLQPGQSHGLVAA